MKTPMALWKKIYIFLAVTIILALNIFVLIYSVRAEMPSYQRRNDPHYVEAVNVEIDRVLGIKEDKLDEVKKALPAGLAEFAVTMLIPDILIIGLAASIYKTKSYRLLFVLAVAGIFWFGYLPRASSAVSSIQCH